MRVGMLTPLAILFWTNACQQISPDNSFCTIAKPIYFDRTDKVSEATKREVYEHFEIGKKLCGWRSVSH